MRSRYRGDISFVIPSWNHVDLLVSCIHSIQKQDFIQDVHENKRLFEIIIVDNGSEKNELAKLFEAFPEIVEVSKNEYSGDIPNYRINVFCLEQNTGFSAAVNRGIKAASGDILVLLNNDIILDPAFVTHVMMYMDEYPNRLHAATKIRQFHHRELLDDVGNALLPTGRAVKIGYHEKDTGQYDKQDCVFSACGAAAVYRKDFFDTVGYFDEDFFAYLEDVDLGFRAQRMGHCCGWIPEAVSYHIGSATTGSMKNTFTVRLLAKNQVGLFIKNMPVSLIVILFLPVLFMMSAQFIKFGFQFNGNGKAFWQGFLEGLHQMNLWIEKRKTQKGLWSQSAWRLWIQLKKMSFLYYRSKRNRI